jgi:uncharacterized protein YndB with AHSA1/START domain
MYEFEGRIFINRSPQDVFNVVTDMSKQPLWQTTVDSVEWDADNPLDVGSTATFITKVLGRKIEMEIQVMAYDPPHQFTWKTLNGPYPTEVTAKFEPQGEGTLHSYKGYADIGGFFKLAEGLAGRQIIKQIDASNENLKLLMESDQF